MGGSQSYNTPTSLTNNGANCYLNSALQGISACDTFVKDIHRLVKETENCEKLVIFHELISSLNRGEIYKKDISRNRIFQNWNKSGQQDSFELLSHILNEVYKELQKEKRQTLKKTNTQEYLTGYLPMRINVIYEINCPCGEFFKNSVQVELALHIAMPQKSKLELQTLVNEFFKSEEIENYFCEKSNCTGKNATKTMKLVSPLPKTICVHLQRTYWNGYKMIKKNKRVKFSDELFIEPDFCESQQSRKIYKLASVIVHSGSPYGGHYKCYKLFKNNWFITDDSKVKRVEKKKVLKCKAYILFYDLPSSRQS